MVCVVGEQSAREKWSRGMLEVGKARLGRILHTLLGTLIFIQRARGSLRRIEVGE